MWTRKAHSYVSIEVPSFVSNSERGHKKETSLFDIGISSCPLRKSETSGKMGFNPIFIKLVRGAKIRNYRVLLENDGC